MKCKKKKLIHCANCGMALETYPKALPKTGRIITLIPPHECLSEPLDLDIKPLNVPIVEQKNGDKKFVQKLDKLYPLSPITDRRDKDSIRQEKSTAPLRVLEQLNALPNSNPEGDFDEPANE